MRVVIGIDPGQKGGIGITENGTTLTELHVMPEAIQDFVRLLSRFDPKTTVIYLEKSQPMPKQGVTSVFTYGVHFGSLHGIIIALRFPHWLIQPKAWQKEAFLGTKSDEPKKRAAEAAHRIFPDADFIATSRSRKPHEGLVDAGLITWWGYRHATAKLEDKLPA